MRLVDVMNQAPRCGATARVGGQCAQPAVKCRRRCRMHGGAPGSGGQPGNRNALKTGQHTAEAIAWRRALRVLLRKSQELVEEISAPAMPT